MSLAEMAHQETQTEAGRRRAERDRQVAAAERAVLDAVKAWFTGRTTAACRAAYAALGDAYDALAKLEVES